MKGEFWCSSCGKSKPDRLLAGHSQSGRPRCVSCEERAQKRMAKRPGETRKDRKATQRQYAKGVTRPWMFA